MLFLRILCALIPAQILTKCVYGLKKKKEAESVDKPGSVLDSHSSRHAVTGALKQPTRIQCGQHYMDSYLVLLQVGFAMPVPLPDVRCALTAPFHPYLIPSRAIGGLLSVALSVSLRCPGVTWHLCPLEPGLSSAFSFSEDTALNDATV